MGSRRPSELGNRTFDASRDSIWAVRQSYGAYREAVADILKPRGITRKGPTSPVVERMLKDIETIRDRILQNPHADELAQEISAEPALKLAHIPAGSHMLVISRGTNVKYFNDELLGPEVNNVLIDMCADLITAGLKYFRLGDADSCVSATHKTSHYYITQDHIKAALAKLHETLPAEAFEHTTSTTGIGSAQSLEVISFVMRRIEKDIQDAAEAMLEAKIIDLLDSPDGMEQIKKIRAWLSTQLRQIRINFGISEEVHTMPIGKEALKDRFWIDQQAEWGARKAESTPERGRFFDLFTFLDDIDTVRTATLEDPELEEFFEIVTTEDGAKEYKLLKIEVIHNLRKWTSVKKQYQDGDPMLAKYQKLQRYYQAINGIDYITPWIDIDSAHQAISHLEEIVANPSDNIDALKKALLMDQRNDKDCTPEYFHRQGTEFNAAYYVSFDAIGIGDINGRDIELTAIKAIDHLQDHRSKKPITHLKNDLQAILMKVGQKVSMMIRQKFDAAREEIEAALPGVSIFTTRGGDEWHVLIGDPARLDADLVFSTIAQIAQKHGLRVTISYKETVADETAPMQLVSDLDRVEDHHYALDLNERNNATVKAFEKVGLSGIVAIPGTDQHTAALVPYNGSFYEINNISAIAGAIAQLQARGLKVSIDSVMGVLVGVSAS